MRAKQAFTLIELLVVVAIIALLIGIVMPSLAGVRRVSKSAACKHNLHQLAIAMEAYLLSHKDTFPYIAPLPTAELALPENERRPPIYEAIKKEIGGKSEVLLCPADDNLEEPSIPRGRYYDSQGTSYDWNQWLQGKRIGFKGTLWLYDELLQAKAQETWMIYDYEAFHGRKLRHARNILFADLHVGDMDGGTAGPS